VSTHLIISGILGLIAIGTAHAAGAGYVLADNGKSSKWAIVRTIISVVLFLRDPISNVVTATGGKRTLDARSANPSHRRMRSFVLLASLAFASAAHADTTAIYGNAAAKFTMTIKIASNGDIRGEVPGRTYYFVGGKDYFADRTDTGFIVMRLDDMVKVMTEQFAQQNAKLGIPSFTPPPLSLVRKGAVSIKKWSGDAYYIQAANGQMSPQPVAVISHDPSLAELGKAMERQYEKSEMMMGQVMKGHAPRSNMDQVLSSGAAISFAGAELQSVSSAPIPKDEFVLPGQPAPIDDVRKRMIRH
jgi:hypothetical protein